MYCEDYEAMVNGTTKEEDNPYLYFSEEKDRNAALAMQGDVTRARLRHHLHRHINGKGNLTVAFIGGSITWSESIKTILQLFYITLMCPLMIDPFNLMTYQTRWRNNIISLMTYQTRWRNNIISLIRHGGGTT